MAISETDIINQFFKRPLAKDSHTSLGIGDDAALLQVPEGYELATSIDTLVAGVHFPDDTEAFDIGFKALAVSVSDIAAMGAQPTTALLALTLPRQDLAWLQRMSEGLFVLAQQVGVDLVGGDLTRGPLSLTTVVNGLVPTGQALRRSGAKVGDRVWVTGTLGDAAWALQQHLVQRVTPDPVLFSRLNRPTPRVAEGLALRAVATSAMDISDGLMLDLSRLCKQSSVAARVWVDRLPLSSALRHAAPPERAVLAALTGGDDYELLFTLPATASLPVGVEATCIGEIVAGHGVVAYDAKGDPITLERHGYDHFKNL